MRLNRSDLELEVLVNRIDRDELDLQPDYQRGEVWDKTRRQRLIDTVLRGWYIPAIHIVSDPSMDREMVLDGQQRLRTIHSFFSDKISVAGMSEPLSDDIMELDGLRFSQLPVPIQRQVRRFEITVVTLSDYRPEEPSELFFRLNQQYALSPSEKRNALFGTARDQVKALVGDLIEEGPLRRELIGFSNGRLAYDDVVARTCLALQERHIRRQVSNTTVEDFYRKDQFRRDVLDDVRNGGIFLRTCLEEGPKVRLNKATLFTWLVFVDTVKKWYGDYPPREFFHFFEDLKSNEELRLDRGGSIAPLLDIYADRASYRVLDTTSVLIRDLVLHAVFTKIHSGVGPPIDLSPLLSSDLSLNVEKTVLQFIHDVNWGDLP